MKGHSEAALNGALVHTFKQLCEMLAEKGIIFDSYVPNKEGEQQETLSAPPTKASTKPVLAVKSLAESGTVVASNDTERKKNKKIRNLEREKEGEERKQRKAERRTKREEKRQRKEQRSKELERFEAIILLLI